jgi:hypothetical protein
MPSTILQFLTRLNPKVYRYAGPGGLTFNDDWIGIEGVRPWEDFTYDILCARFKTELKKTLPSWDPSDLIKKAHFNETLNEDSVTAFLTVNCMLPVNIALSEVDNELHVGTGSKFARRDGAGSPDWGSGRASQLITQRDNLCPGDVKCSSKWASDGLLNANWNNYEANPQLENLARPLEQIQHYCIRFGTRYGWIMTDNELVVIRATNSTDDEPSSLRQSRAVKSGVGAGGGAHQRVFSNTSTLSSTFSAMSIDPSAYSGHSGSSSGNNIAPLEMVSIPMSASAKAGAKGQLTVNLALFFLVLLADEDRIISSSYPPLNPQADPVGSTSKSTSKSHSKSTSKSHSKSTSKSHSKSTSKHKTSLQSQTDVPPLASKFWISAEAIRWEVINTDIEFYLPGASVQHSQKDGVDGFLITAQASKSVFPDIVSCLKADTLSWVQEGGSYAKSETYSNRRGGVDEGESSDDDDDDDAA